MRHSSFTLFRADVVRAIVAVLATFGLLAAALADNGTTTVYKWIDAQGVVHYSDQPHPNAQKLQIEGAQTFSAPPPPPASAAAAAQQQTQPSGQGYQSCAISQPADQQMLMNAYDATVVVRSSPPLRSGDAVRLFVDGKQIQGSGTEFTFPVNRGQHSVQALIEDNTGQVVCETSTVTFYVHQPSVQNPHNPAHPH